MCETIKCKKCGRKMINDGVATVCDDCKRKSMPRVYFVIATTILIVGFVLGIILGATNKELKMTASKADAYDSEISYEYKEQFNSSLMFNTWGVSFIISAILYSTSSTCARLNLLIDKK